MEKISTNDTIFKAAMEEFLEKGYDGSRMQSIADRAGINKALLHYHYKNKENLYNTVFRVIFQDFFSSIMSKIDTGLEIKEYLKQFIDNYIDNVSQRKHMLKFILWELENEGKNIGAVIREISPFKNPLSMVPIFSIIEDAKKRGIIRNLDPSHLILNIVSMCLWPFVAHRLVANIWNNDIVEQAEFIQDRKREINNLIWKGISAENDTDDTIDQGKNKSEGA